MSTTKATMTAAAIAVGLAGALTLHEVRAGHEAVATLATQQQETATLATQVQAWRARLARAEADNAALAALAAKAKPSMPPTPGKAAAAADDNNGFPRDGSAFLKAHPEVRTALAASLRGYNLKEYADLFQALHLTAEQIDEFVHIQSLATTSIVGGNLLCTLGEKSLTGPEVTEQLRALLGDEGYQLYRNHGRASLARDVITELSGSVYFTATPLTVAQAGQFQAIVNEVVADPPDGKPIRSGWRQFSPAVWDALLEKSAGVLAEPQQAILRDLRQQSAFQVAQSSASSAYYRNATAAPVPAK